MLITDVLPYLNRNGLERLEGDYDRFLQAVKSKAPQTDVTWQSILNAFLFLPEADKISQILREQHNVPEEKLREIRHAIEQNEC